MARNRLRIRKSKDFLKHIRKQRRQGRTSRGGPCPNTGKRKIVPCGASGDFDPESVRNAMIDKWSKDAV